MTTRQRLLPLAAVCLMFTAPVCAEGFYAGAGLNLNSYTAEDSDFDDAVGLQVFAGYGLGTVFGVDRLSLSLEATYFDSGEFEQETDLGTVNIGSVAGLSASAVLAFALTDTFALTGRGGYDLGDDDGALLGVGAAFRFGERFTLGGELVGREHVDSFQLNMSYRF